MLHVLVGIPGAGKSTYARKLILESVVDVIHSSDAIRLELYGDETNVLNHKEVFDIVRQRVEATFQEGKSPLVDATNLSPADREPYLILAKRYGFVPRVWLFQMPFCQCQERNMGRERVVPTDAMERMYKRFWENCSPEQLAREGWEVNVVRDW